MKVRVFIDTTTLIYGFESKDSNSGKILELINDGKIEGVVSEKVLKEVMSYFMKYYGIQVVRLFRSYIVLNFIMVPGEFVKDFMNKLKGEIKEKDLEQLAVVKKYGIKYLVAFDRDFEKFPEYYTPKQFIEEMGVKASDSEF